MKKMILGFVFVAVVIFFELCYIQFRLNQKMQKFEKKQNKFTVHVQSLERLTETTAKKLVSIKLKQSRNPLKLKIASQPAKLSANESLLLAGN